MCLRALGYFRRDWPLIVVWVVLIAASTALGLLASWPMAVLVDSVLAVPAVAAPAKADAIHRLFLWPLPGNKVGRVIGLAGCGLVLKFLGDLLGAAQSVVSNQINYNGLTRVRCELFGKVQAMHLAFHRARPQGDIIYRLTSDAYGFQSVLGVLVTAVVAGCTLIVMTGVLACRSVPLTLLAFSVAPLLAVTNVVFGRRLKRRSIDCKEVDSRLTSVVQRSVGCINLVQAFGREDAELGQFRSCVRDAVRAGWRLNAQQLTYNLIIGLLFGLGGAAVFGYGGYLVYRDTQLRPTPDGMTVGDLMVFTAYLGMLWGPLCTLTGFAANLQGGAAGVERVLEVLDRDPAIADAPGAVALPSRPRTLELCGVSFAYPTGATEGADPGAHAGADADNADAADYAGDGTETDSARPPAAPSPVLRDVSVKIEPGQMVAFVGSSGVGKSTLLNLLPRFYDPTAGSIRLDGIDARDVRLADLRRHVALVLQDNLLLPTTVARNIAYGCPGASAQAVRRAASLAGAAEFIDALPEGYDTVVAEGGANLSGGQRQRLAIARALLTGAPFLVLDEPTSALDPHHEQRITRLLRSLKGQRTILLVSHRLSTVADCDQIFVMDGGRIAERGTHGQLLARGGLYYEMARHQLNLDPPLPLAA